MIEIEKNGKYVQAVEKLITCVNTTADNVSLFDTEYGETLINNVYDSCTATSESDMAYGEEEYSLKLYGGAGRYYPLMFFSLAKPVIKDISAYNYLYFYVYTDSDNVSMVFNGIYSPSPAVIAKGQWTQVVCYKDGDGIWKMPCGTAMFGTTGASEEDISGLQFYFNAPTGKETNIYISAIRVSNQNPAA